MILSTIQRTWKKKFAILPVKLANGDLVWWEYVEWRHYVPGIDGSLTKIYRRPGDVSTW